MARHHYTYADYFSYERDSLTRHEFVDGEILALAGSSLRHSALAANISAAIERGRRPGCYAFSCNQKVRVLATDRIAYPDVSMICGSIERDPTDPYDETITNPALLVEVLSPATEEVDRSTKWRDYQLIPSLQEYVLASQGSPRIEIYRRLASARWEYLDVREGVVKLSTGATLDLSDLYDNLPE